MANKLPSLAVYAAGKELAASGKIKDIGPSRRFAYLGYKQSIGPTDDDDICTCPASVTCKHIVACRILLTEQRVS